MQNNFDNAVEIGEEIVGVDLNDVKWDDPAPETKNNAVEIGEEIPDADLSKVQWDAPSDAQSAMEGKPEPRRPISSSLVRRSFTGDDGFAFIDDADVKSAFIQTIRLADDPDAEMKKWAVAAHLTKNDRRQIGYIVGNIDNACKIYFGKKTSVEQAYNQIRESYMPKAPEPAPTPDQILDRAVHNVPHGDLSAIPKELALGIFNRIMMLKWAHWDLPAEDILEEKALAKRDAALDKSRQKYHAQSESQWRKLFGVDQVKVADDPLTGREIFQDIDEARKFRIEGPFSKTPPLIDRLGVAVPPVEPKWNVDFGSQKAEADNAEMEKNYMAYVRKFPELYSYAKDAETATDVQRAYRMEVEKRFAEKNGEQAFAEVKTQADTAQKNSDLAFESRNREAVHIYRQDGRSGLRQQIISEKKHLDQLFAENEKKYHSGKSLGENWKDGDAVGLVHEALAICFDQVAKSIVPMAIENAAANAVLPGSGIAKTVSGALFWHDMFAEGTVQAIENDPEISDADRLSYARTYAALEVIPEYLFGWFKIFDKFHVSNEVKKGFWNGVLDFGKTGAEDTFGEVITFIGEKILDADNGYGTPGGKKAAEMSAEEFKEFFLDGLPETVVGSFFTAGAGDTASHFARHAAEEKYRGQLAQRIEELEKTEARTDVQERELDLLRNAVHSDDMTEVAAALAVSQVLRQKKGITPDQARDTLSPEDRAAQAIRDNGVRNAIHFDAQDTVREVEVVKDLLHLNDRTRINAVETFDALPDVVKQDIQKKKLSPDAVDAYYYDGKCYIISDRVNPAKVFSRVLHEYVTHFGLRQTLGEAQFNDFMDLVFEEHADEITGSPLAESYGFDPDAEMPENARLTKQRELAEEWLARKAEEIAPLLRRGIENAEVGRWRKFIGRIRQFLAEHRLLPKSYLDRLDDRTLTDLLRRTLGNAGYELDAVREDSGNFENSGNDGRNGDGRADVGDAFGTIRNNVVPEIGQTALFNKKFRSFSDIASDLFQIYNSFPESITAADGQTVFIRNKQNDRDSARLFHLIASKDETNGNRNTIEINTKVPWITRIPETLEKAQVKLQDNKSKNYIYARSYTDGYWHFIVVSKDGVVIGGNSYQHGLITQFAEDHSSNRDNFAIVWESYGKTSKQPNRAQGGGSQGYAPSSSPGNRNNISQKNGLSNPADKKNQKKSGMPSVDPAAHLDPTLEDNMIEALLLPVKKANGELSALLDGGALKYLIDNGFPDVGNVTARYLTIEANARLDEIKRKQSRAAAFQNYRDMDPLFDFIVEFAGGGENVIVNPGEKYVDSDVSGSFISPSWKKYAVKRPQGAKESDASYRKYLAKRDAALAKVDGVNLNEIARAYVRQFGGDEAEIEQKMFDLLKDLKKKDISSIYATYKKDHLAYEKKLNEEAEAEFRALKEQQAKDDAAKMLSDGGEITSEFIKAHRDVVDEIYRQLLGKEPPEKIGKKDLAALNAALMAEGTDTKSTFAQAYKVAAEKAYFQFAEKLRELRDAEAKDDAAINALQQKAMDFAEKNLPKEHRGDFIRQIVALAKMSDANGKRSEAFEKLLQRMVDTANEARKKDAVAKIKKLLHDNRTTRKGRGIPQSRVWEIERELAEIRKISRFGVGALESYRNAQTEILLLSPINSNEHIRAAENLNNAGLFGDLEHRKAQDATTAMEYLEKLIDGAKSRTRERLNERLHKIDQLRHAVMLHVSGGVANFSKNNESNRKVRERSKVRLQNDAFLENLLREISGTVGEEFYETVEGDLAHKYFLAQEAKDTDNRILTQELRDAAGKIFGFKSFPGYCKFINSINKKVKHTGVFREIYTAKIERKNGGEEYLVGRRPADRHHVNALCASEAFGRDGDAITAFIGFKKDPEGRIAAQELLAGKGIDSDIFTAFVVEGKDAANVKSKEIHVYALDRNNEVQRAVFPLADFPGRRIPLSDVARRFAQKQCADVEAGVEPTYSDFKDQNDAATIRLLKEDETRGAQIELLGAVDCDVSSVEMTNMSRNQALQLILEYEQDVYKDNFSWNGFTEKTIKQLYDFVGKDLLDFGHWMRENFAKNRPRLDQVATEKYGAHLPDTPNYWPGVFSDAASGNSGFERNAGLMSMNPSFLIGRRGHLKPPEPYVGAVTKFLDQSTAQNYFVENQECAGLLAEVFGDGAVGQAITDRLGANFYRDLKRRIAEYAKGGAVVTKIGDDFWALMSRYYAVSKMAFSLPSYFKQRLGAFAYMYEIPVKDFVKYSFMAKVRSKEFRDFKKFALASDYFKNRQAGGLSPEMRFLMDKAFDGNFNWFTSLAVDAGMSLVTAGDAWATIHGGFTVYQHYLDAGLRNGMSEADARKNAEYMWMKVTDETQQSTKVTHKNYYSVGEEGSFGRFMTLFMSNDIQTMSLVLQSIDELKVPGNTGARARLAKRLFLSHIVMPSLMYLVSQLFRHGIDFDEYDWDELVAGCVMGTAGALAYAKIFTPIVEAISKKCFGEKSWARSASVIPTQNEVEHTMRTTNKILGDKEFTAADYADAVQSFGEILEVAGSVSGSPGIGQLGGVISALGLRSRQFIKLFEKKKKGSSVFK